MATVAGVKVKVKPCWTTKSILVLNHNGPLNQKNGPTNSLIRFCAAASIITTITIPKKIARNI